MARPTEQFKADLNLWTNRHNGVRKEPRRAIVIHTDESAYNYATGTVRASGWTAKRLAEYNREPGVRGSYHVGADVAESTVRQVNDRGGTWSVGNQGNNEAIHLCAAGSTAYWTREQWMARPKLLNNLAKVAAHSALFHGIPIRKIDHVQLRAGSWGICGHWDYSKAYGGSSHWDPGGYSDTAGGFPWDHFIDLVAKHADYTIGATVIEHEETPALDTAQKEVSTMSAIDSRRIELVLDQLAGPGKNEKGEPTFEGWDYASIVEAARHNLENGLGLTLVQQIALVMEAQEEQRKNIETMAAAISALTSAIARDLAEKENDQ